MPSPKNLRFWPIADRSLQIALPPKPTFSAWVKLIDIQRKRQQAPSRVSVRAHRLNGARAAEHPQADDLVACQVERDPHR